MEELYENNQKNMNKTNWTDNKIEEFKKMSDIRTFNKKVDLNKKKNEINWTDDQIKEFKKMPDIRTKNFY